MLLLQRLESCYRELQNDISRCMSDYKDAVQSSALPKEETERIKNGIIQEIQHYESQLSVVVCRLK